MSRVTDNLQQRAARGDIGLTTHGIAWAAASAAMVLTDPTHPNHSRLCEEVGLPIDPLQNDKRTFKYAGFSGPHPTLVVPCPACGSPVAHYCVDRHGRPVDGPHEERRALAGTASAEGRAAAFHRKDH